MGDELKPVDLRADETDEKEGIAAELFTGYAEFLTEVKERVCNAQVRAALAVNSELLFLY